ncbi:MAG: histidine phosphatase family protein [Alphaproteobacteria bacterium]|nr:MAG: histidine phosphatase family protein [Alphaproteobacteria bacterium]
MKRLVLIRHAKSSWSDPELEDFDRPLNHRGRMAAPVAGAWLAEAGLTPDHVLLSPARRCVETWERMARQLDHPPAPRLEPELYMADPDTMLRILRNAPATAGTVLLIGHQPGLSSLARRLAGGEVPASCQRAFRKFPTAAVAVIAFDIADWAEADFGKGVFRSFVTPRDLV